MIATAISGGGPGGSGGGGTGDVTGPAGATDTAIPVYNGATGKIIKDSALLLSATNRLTIPGRVLGKQGADVPSDTDLTLTEGNYFYVTGNTAIHGIITTGWTAGSVVVLQFDAAVVIHHSGVPDIADPILLSGAANFNATAGDTLTLIRDEDAGFWRETGRSVI